MRRHESRQVPPRDPKLSLPAQRRHPLVRPGHQDASRAGIGLAVVIVQRGNHLIADPLAQRAMLGVAEAIQRPIKPGLADQLQLLATASSKTQRRETVLVGIQALGQSIGAGGGDHHGEVDGNKPGAVVDHHRAQLMAMALKGDGDGCVMHGEVPIKVHLLAPYVHKRFIALHGSGGKLANVNGLSNPATGLTVAE